MRSALLVLLACFAVYGQFEQGLIVGIVSDPQNAPIAGAPVQIRSTTTNVARDVTTSTSGEYNSLPLTPGRYTVTVRMMGFKERSIRSMSA